MNFKIEIFTYEDFWIKKKWIFKIQDVYKRQIYYPIFGSFAAEAGVHLEDVLLNEKYRHCGLGRKFFSKIEEFVKEDGYSKMEWSCLDWNTPSIRFYDKIGATQEQGRVYFSYNCKQIWNRIEKMRCYQWLNENVKSYQSWKWCWHRHLDVYKRQSCISRQ